MLADGRELIDGIASWWTACHGYNHPHIRAAVERQLASMPHVMFGGLVHEQALTLARRLAAICCRADLDRVFFCESGSVAVEIAMKMAVQYWLNRGERGRDHVRRLQGRLSRRHHRRDGGERSGRRHARRCSTACCPSTSSPTCRATTASGGRARRVLARARRRDRGPDRRAAGAGRGRHAVPRRAGAAPPARRPPIGMACC